MKPVNINSGELPEAPTGSRHLTRPAGEPYRDRLIVSCDVECVLITECEHGTEEQVIGRGTWTLGRIDGILHTYITPTWVIPITMPERFGDFDADPVAYVKRYIDGEQVTQ